MSDTSALTLYRKLHGITQAELAEQVGVRDGTICKWEKGRVPAEQVQGLSKLTGIPAHRLRPDLYPEPEATS